MAISGVAKQFLRVGDSGSRALFSFCPFCGATVYYVTEGNEEFIVIPVGAFADPSFPAPVLSVYEERMHRWVKMPAEIEHIE